MKYEAQKNKWVLEKLIELKEFEKLYELEQIIISIEIQDFFE
jgi:hypothetical protein